MEKFGEANADSLNEAATILRITVHSALCSSNASLPLWAATSLRCPPPCDDVLVLLLDDRIGRQNGETMPSSLKNAPGGNGGASSLTYASGGMGGTVPS